MISCNICGRKFKNRRSLANHMRWHDLPKYKDFQQKIRERMKGKNNPAYGIHRTGKDAPFYGHRHTEESKKKTSDALMGEKNHNYGDKGWNWKGNKVGYKALHQWISKRKKKLNYCEICGEKRYVELSNKDHKYTRNINDYQWLCVPCHRKRDKEL